jgi:SAM-dependent methyltransferase
MSSSSEERMKPSGSESQEAISEFFDRQQESNQYASLKNQTQLLDLDAAEHLNRDVTGKVLTIGGMWDHFEWRDHLESLTVLDLSKAMLDVYCPEGAEGIVGDMYEHEFEPESFDSVIYPLMLHHTPEGNWGSCERRIEEAVDRAKRWLRPGGRLFILEYCPHPAWYPVERGLLPLTRAFLTYFNQPMVVMYTRGFYERVLGERFERVSAYRVAPEGFNYWAWYPVFMSIRWLRMPFAMYPKMHIFTANKAATA